MKRSVLIGLFALSFILPPIANANESCSLPDAHTHAKRCEQLAAAAEAIADFIGVPFDAEAFAEWCKRTCGGTVTDLPQPDSPRHGSLSR